MRILFFIDSLRSGGKERRLVELIKGLSNFPEIEMEIVLTREDIHYTDIFSTNIKIHYLIRKKGKKDITLFYKLYVIANKFKPDIIHVWENLVAKYAIPTKLLLRTPMINNEITNATRQKSTSILNHRLTFSFSNKIIANTYAGLKAYNATKYKSCVIYNGFDFQRISKLEDESLVRNRFNITTKYVIGMVASFSDKKDYDTYIKAANFVLEKEKDVSFLCIGSGDSTEYKKMVSDKNKKRILFLGKQDHVESIMNVCDIGVLMTNSEHGEGISNAILEFNALAKPVIASMRGGTSEIIENEVSGILIKDNSTHNLVEKILFLLHNYDIRVDYGKNAKQIIKDKFGIKRMIDEFKTIYKEVVY